MLAGEIQLPHAWTAVSDQTGAYFVEMACLALAECRLKGFKQHVQARDRSAAHTSRTKTRPSRCLNGAAAADAQVLQQRSSGSSTRQVQGMPAGFPSCRFQGEDGEPRRASARHQLVATAVVARAVSYAVSPNNEWNDFFLEEVRLCPLFMLVLHTPSWRGLGPRGNVFTLPLKGIAH